MSSVFSHQEGLILDACCVINLYASGYMRAILQALPKPVAVAAYVCEVETMRVYSGPAERVLEQSKSIDLNTYINESLLQVIHPTENEEKTVLRLSSAALDSGEAITAALAIHRSWFLGTDDKAAIAFLQQKAPEIQVISTLDIVKQWADTTCSPFAMISGALNNIQMCARYQPHRNHSLYRWWKHYQTPCR